jgi:chromosome segregation ATPase
MSSPKVAYLQAELHATHKTAAKQQAEVEPVSADYKQQLSSTQAQLQQQRQAIATAQVESAGKVFSCARLAAQINSLHAETREAKHKHQAATAEATAIRAERDAALQAVADERMHHRATEAALDVSFKELPASHAALGALHIQLSSARQELKQQKQKATAALAAVQQSLSNMTQRMQLNRQAAAKASAAAGASRFAAARTAAQHHTLEEEVEQVRMQRDAAAALAFGLSTQLQQANAGQQVAEHALAAHRRLHSAATTAKALA